MSFTKHRMVVSAFFGFLFLTCCKTSPSLEIPVESVSVLLEVPREVVSETVVVLTEPAVWNIEKPVVFKEVWGYVSAGEEKLVQQGMPLSDVCVFGAGLNTFGKLVGVPDVKKLAHFTGRKHLVVADNGKALTHFCLDPSFSVRNELLEAILKAAAPFDGLQIDFEYVSVEDRQHFWSFLETLRRRLPAGKMLTVALPARTRVLKDDIYDYQRILPFVDRILVMAYDQHWSGSKPGSIAELDWCFRVAQYSLSAVGREKLVMGLPFYGRAWADTNPARAYKFSALSDLRQQKNIEMVERKSQIPTFSYEQTVQVTVYYEDAQSVLSRASLYADNGVGAIGFWKVGQEDGEVWKYLRLQ